MKKLAIHGGAKTITDDTPHFIWPRITSDSQKAVTSQLHKTISIYDRSGIFGTFEDTFARYHGKQHGLLSNSGTSAIFSMYEGINLQLGDEVLCPVYTFHATVSPLIYSGALPIFCDCDDAGNISLKEVKAKYNKRTKAVIVTHMWGMPARDIQAIRDFCDEKKIYLLEDCSHAHGASIDGKIVGSYGDASAWSLQGQKTITGGEGGIMLTDNKSVYERALLQGHYNKRPKQEIDGGSSNHKYFLTGLGLKLRAHPLAIALAQEQFSKISAFLRQRQIYAQKLNEALAKYEFLKIPSVTKNVRHSWYAYTLQFVPENAFGISREEFVEALHAEGLEEVDVPGSTGLLNELPLFLTPQDIMPRLYKNAPKKQLGFPRAEQFTSSIIKLPVWTFPDEEKMVNKYIKGICKVADYLATNKNLASN